MFVSLFLINCTNDKMMNDLIEHHGTIAKRYGRSLKAISEVYAVHKFRAAYIFKSGGLVLMCHDILMYKDE